jgi:hypothetical protein
MPFVDSSLAGSRPGFYVTQTISFQGARVLSRHKFFELQDH